MSKQSPMSKVKQLFNIDREAKKYYPNNPVIEHSMSGVSLCRVVRMSVPSVDGRSPYTLRFRVAS